MSQALPRRPTSTVYKTAATSTVTPLKKSSSSKTADITSKTPSKTPSNVVPAVTKVATSKPASKPSTSSSNVTNKTTTGRPASAVAKSLATTLSKSQPIRSGTAVVSRGKPTTTTSTKPTTSKPAPAKTVEDDDSLQSPAKKRKLEETTESVSLEIDDVDNLESTSLMEDDASMTDDTTTTTTTTERAIAAARAAIGRKDMVEINSSVSVKDRMRMFEDKAKQEQEKKDQEAKIRDLHKMTQELAAAKEKLMKTLELSNEEGLGLKSDLHESRTLLTAASTLNKQQQEDIKKLNAQLKFAEYAHRITKVDLQLADHVRSYLLSKVLELKGNIRVYCRVRPILSREKQASITATSTNKADSGAVLYGSFTFPEEPHPCFGGDKMKVFQQLQQDKQQLLDNQSALMVDGVDMNVDKNSVDETDAFINNSTVRNTITINTEEKTVTNATRAKSYVYTYDRVFTPHDGNNIVYQDVDELVQSVVDAFNVNLIVYGQTGSGKTYTMEGTGIDGNNNLTTDAGIIYNSVHNIYKKLNKLSHHGYKSIVKVNVLEVFNDDVYSLLPSASIVANLSHADDVTNRNTVNRFKDAQLNIEATKVDIKLTSKTDPEILSEFSVFTSEESKSDQGYISNFNEKDLVPMVSCAPITVFNIGELYTLISVASGSRQKRTTNMNTSSSRSHLIVQLHVYTQDSQGCARGSTLNLVDLAGSEKLKQSGVTGKGEKEAISINTSLSSLGDVISQLNNRSNSSNNAKQHIPFRNSKLTYLLQPCFEDNSKTLVIVNCSPLDEHIPETTSTLGFANKMINCTLKK